MTWFKRQRVTIQAAIIGALITGIIGGIFVLLGPIASEIAQRLFDNSDLELVDVSFEETTAATKLDVKVRNTGEKVAYLKEARFKVKKTWELRAGPYPFETVMPSENYDIAFTPAGTPYTRTTKTSQSIEPNKVDRFTFTLGLDPEQGLTHYIFLVDVDLLYDADDKVISSENLLFVREKPLEPFSHYYFYPEGATRSAVKITAHNQQVLNEVRNIKGIKTESLKELIHYTSRQD